MATDTLEIFGKEWTGVTGIDATDDSNQVLTYLRGDSAVLFQDENGYINLPSAEVESLAIRAKTGTTGSSSSRTLSITNIPSEPIMFCLQFGSFTATKTGGTQSATTVDVVFSCMYDGFNCTTVSAHNSGVYSSSTVYAYMYANAGTFTYAYSGTTLTITLTSVYFPSSTSYNLLYVC